MQVAALFLSLCPASTVALCHILDQATDWSYLLLQDSEPTATMPPTRAAKALVQEPAVQEPAKQVRIP